MLETLLKIGQWQSETANEWDRFLEPPKVSYNDKKGNPITNYTVPIIFDLDEMDIVVTSSNLKEYDESDVLDLKALKVQGGNNKAIYSTVPANKIIQLYKTFFGKENKDDAREGELSEAIKKDFDQLQNSTLHSILQKVFELKERFTEIAGVQDEKRDRTAINIKTIENLLGLEKGNNLALIYAAVKASRFGFNQPVAVAKLQDYENLIRQKFFGPENDNDQTNSIKESLCYASGAMEPNVEAIDLSTRYSLNKMFVTETRNYAGSFDRENFKINYKVSRANQEKLDYASTFLLNNYKTRIANIDHVIIPQFLNKENIDLELVLNGIKHKSDLLFHINEFEGLEKDIKMETEDVFWINFIAFESDGKFFKSTEIIKDVSQFHFQKVIEAFQQTDWEMKEFEYVNWDSVMNEFGKRRRFNLNTVYGLIPIRKDKEKMNMALELFKTILENRQVHGQQLFSHFKELMLCHYFQRYKSYSNVLEYTPEYFGKAIHDSVFKYLAFFEVLKNLNLIKMDTTNQYEELTAESTNKYNEAIQRFFDRMDLNQAQKAMFYLGRILSMVAYLQKDKNKTVIDKVNYSGMDRDSIIRLRIDLFEKAKQYGESKRIVFSDGEFAKHFDFEKWNMDPNEAVFFILTGFSFIVKL